MRSDSETKLYISQLIAGYTCGKKIPDALRECCLIIPEEALTGKKISKCINMLTTGEDLPEEAPLRSALSVIDEGEPLLVILHDMIEEAEATGRIKKELFAFFEEMVSFTLEAKDDQKKRKKSGKSDKSVLLYEKLGKCRNKTTSKRLQKRIINDIKNELILFMISMVIYTRTAGISQALKRTQSLTSGLVKAQLKCMRKGFESGTSTDELCMHFFDKLDIPEVRQCIISCFSRKQESFSIPLYGDLFEVGEYKRKKYRKELCAVGLAVIIGVMGITGIISKDDKKEGRLKNALSQALMVAVGDMKEEKGTNQIMAGFMQQMLKQVDDDIDLTVRICDLDRLDQTMEVEAIGEYESFLGDRRRISVRRRLSF